jgi:HSP20 family protein
MNLVRWNPINEFSSLQSQMNRFFQEALGNSPFESSRTTNWTPVADICETDESLFVKVELPGVDPKMVDVRLENNILTIRGQREFDQGNEKTSYHRIERTYGMFSRAFALPVSVDPDNIRAEFKNGLLTVTLPKSERARPKRIEIAAATA